MSFVSDFIGGITGSDAADAAGDAAQAQLQGTRESIKAQKGFLKKVRGDLAPFRRAGVNQLSELGSLISDPNAQLNFVQNNPFFNAMAKQAQDSLFANQAARGKVGSGDTAAGLQNRLLMLGSDLLNQSIGQRFNLATMGQNAAAQTGSATQNTGNAISDLITGGANAQASGIVGEANARAQGAQNILGAGLNLGGMIALSDRRMKTDVEKIGQHSSGIPIYSYKYVGSPYEIIGVMAQDVEPIVPGAVLDVFGVKYVDYAELERWLSIH